MRFPPFLYIGLFLLAVLHYSLWLRLVRDTDLPAPWSAMATTMIVVLFFLVPATFYVYRTHVAPAWPFIWPGFVWMGALAIIPLWLGGSELVALGARLGDLLRGSPPDPARRLLLLRTLGIAVAAGSALTAAVALREGLRKPSVKEVEVPLRRLPRSLDGTTIVQLTDVHVGPTIGRPFMENLVRRTNALEPDLVAITGDLVDGTVAELAEAVAPLRDLRARWGVYFVTGNHEYYSGIEGWLAHLPSLGVRVLRNERVSVGANGDSFDVAGIEDYSAHYYPGFG
ncbi:MAG TPA: metallophosphoesterase, partial [bacterium]|nr:metallophosphoesterase [bacterium]